VTLHKTIALLGGLMLAGAVLAAEMSDAQVRELIVRNSIIAYSGSCPCPGSDDAAGRTCGGRSAHSRPGGAKVICYSYEVTAEQIREFRAQHPL
jgi:hypothetical protein